MVWHLLQYITIIKRIGIVQRRKNNNRRRDEMNCNKRFNRTYAESQCVEWKQDKRKATSYNIT